MSFDKRLGMRLLSYDANHLNWVRMTELQEAGGRQLKCDTDTAADND